MKSRTCWRFSGKTFSRSTPTGGHLKTSGPSAGTSRSWSRRDPSTPSKVSERRSPKRSPSSSARDGSSITTGLLKRSPRGFSTCWMSPNSAPSGSGRSGKNSASAISTVSRRRPGKTGFVNLRALARKRRPGSSPVSNPSGHGRYRGGRPLPWLGHYPGRSSKSSGRFPAAGLKRGGHCAGRRKPWATWIFCAHRKAPQRSWTASAP